MNKITTENILAVLLAVVPSCMVIGFLPFHILANYVLFALLILYGFSNGKIKINIALMLLILCAAIGIFYNDPPPIFMSWLRLGNFVLVLSAISLLFVSPALNRLRRKAFQILLYLACGISVLSFFGYFAGINYMQSGLSAYNIYRTSTSAGLFGGITWHSMLLAPISAVALVFLTDKLLYFKGRRIHRFMLIGAFFATFCCLMLAASRIAFVAALGGVAALLYLNFRKRSGKLLKYAVTIGLGLVILYPFYSNFATPLINKQRNNIEEGSIIASRSDKWMNRLEEFSSSPLVGIGFSAVDVQNTDDYNMVFNSIEPGSSWLVLLSMTGILGTVAFLFVVIPIVRRLYAMHTRESAFVLSILCVFFLHLLAEGYIYSAGSYLFYLFWFSLGIGYSLNKTDRFDTIFS